MILRRAARCSRDYAQPGRPGRPAIVAAAALLWYWAQAAPIRATATSFTRFYMRVWALFFLEYLLVPIACLST